MATSHAQEGCFFQALYPFILGPETGVGTEQVRVPEPEQALVGEGRFLQDWAPTWSKSRDGREAKMVAPVAYHLGEVGQVGLSSPMSHSLLIC